MAPMLGIMASAISGNLVTNSFESIATATANGGSSSVSFTSIPATYTHLQIRAISKNTFTSADGADNVEIVFNSTTGIYSRHYMYVSDNLSEAYQQINLTRLNISNAMPRTTSWFTNKTAAWIMDIYDYTSTTKVKNCLIMSSLVTNANSQNDQSNVQVTGAYQSTIAAITQIDIRTALGNIAADCTFALYGIKG